MATMKRTLAVLLTAVLLVLMLPTAFAENEILISTKEQFNAIRNDLSANYKLANDLVFQPSDFAEGGAFYNDGALFVPFGSSKNAFTGTFDGAGHRISGLKINGVFSDKEKEPLCGLFIANEGTIQNVEVDVTVTVTKTAVDGEIFSRTCVGAIAARNDVGGSILRCSVAGSISAQVAGLSYVQVGGLVGTNNGSIADCRNLADISADADTNQWVGVGGIVGYGAHNSDIPTLSDVRRCYNIGKLQATTTAENKSFLHIGGVVGRNQQHGVVLDCYYLNISAPVGVYTYKDREAVPYDETEILTQCPDVQIRVKPFDEAALEDPTTFEGFDFNAVWVMQLGMPSLQVFGEHEHNWGEGVVTVPATCTEIGSKTSTCSVCGETKTEEIPATGHKWNTDFTVDKVPTCTEAGSKSIHCSVCDAKKDVTVIPVTSEHTWNTGFTVDKAATCAANGSKSIHCSVCGAKKDVTVIPATGKHTAGAWITLVKPTASTTGISVQKCTVCGKELARKTLAKTGDPCAAFTDINRKSWYHSAVDYAIEHKLFNGITQTTFAPDSKMTRGMFVTVLGRLKGVSAPKSATKFKDVAKSSYCSGYVKWASEAGIVNGTSPTTFAPDAPVTREQICKMMTEYCNFAGVKLKNVNAPMTFKDANQISGWAKGYVATCQKAGLVNGSDGKFNPKGEASRAEVAQILTNFSKNYLKV